MYTEQEILALRVADAKPRDVGSGIVRIDVDDIVKLGAETGDIVEIKGNRVTAAKVMPLDDRGKSSIQMDVLLRGNARVLPGERVSIRKTRYSYAEKIILSPLTPAKPVKGNGDTSFLLREGLPLVEGDVVRANLLDTRSQDDFIVNRTRPQGIVIISTDTRFEIIEKAEADPGSPKVLYDDIGGLQNEVRKVREMIELPLKYPQVFERLGIDPPKGVLLHGPSGCGKTLIARAVANETSSYFVHISGPEIMEKLYGESEARLRAIFKEAKANAPAILFIDEIDAIAPKREALDGDKQVERRVVAQLLALMDGLDSRGNVVIIGATNIPNSLDTALRRPGRFDREISISIPDKQGRLDILNIHTRGMPLGKEVDLNKVAEVTHGFVGADLKALCREAAMNASRRIMPGGGFQPEKIPDECILHLKVTMNDFRDALKEVGPSAMREVFVEVPDVKWEDIGGMEKVKLKLLEAVKWPLDYAELFQEIKIKPPKGILLSGPPGTGKTLIARALANESGVNFISVKGSEIMSKYFGESEKGVTEVFRKAKQSRPSILFFDEFDSLVPRRGLSGDSQITERVISQFLTELDGLEELKGVLVLAATNRKDLIDFAIVRPGRFDLVIEITLPDETARFEIFRVHTRGKPLAGDVDLNLLAREAENMSGADIDAICREASMKAIREYINSGAGMSRLQIKRKHFGLAMIEVQKRRESQIRVKPDFIS